jgi:hypothetical protein
MSGVSAGAADALAALASEEGAAAAVARMAGFLSVQTVNAFEGGAAGSVQRVNAFEGGT